MFKKCLELNFLQNIDRSLSSEESTGLLEWGAGLITSGVSIPATVNNPSVYGIFTKRNRNHDSAK